MKNIQKTIMKIIVVMVMVVVPFSCQDRLDDLRDNPNAVTSIDDAALFTKAVRSLFLGTTDQSVSRFSGHYGHYFVAGSTARIPDQYGDGFDGQYNGMFNDMYGGVIRHIEEVLEITSAEETKNEVRHSIANIIAVLGYAKITDAFGEIPFTEGGKGKTQDIILPKYDTQEVIYREMIARLTTSIDILKTADASMAYPNSDPVFNNDMDKWVRFANSVRLRLAMRLRYADSALSQQTVAQCLSEPLMEDNAHNAFMIETEGNGNAWFTMRTGFPSIKMSTMLIDQLQATTDPRLPVFVSEDANGSFSGMTNGLDDAAFGASNFAAKSDMGTRLSSPDSKLYIMTASETWLLRAEAALVYNNDPTQANTLYRKGIETSLNQWEVDASEIVSFMASPTATLSGSNDEEQIGTQMWLALIPNYFEGWSHIRRTGYPVIADRTAANLSQGVTNGVLPTRFLYSSFELSSNNDNVMEAISRQGANKIDTPVWWDKN
ncbi:SusD/RagB family nutrient-binding outer membrane lipoprotein [Hwangdonia lutea]|uniref:SusD/RagB family nutrient-binding outer membrane lipoprotein n=1 Tax=Hwangdonia lutea TaxID=3075823 RepID=A0AA97EPI9_9FLAO|nr:SusD/RagB family nutrient-binding outer membrane lipoprotein [Hwangdonia sp. SCSIO 19198]WOD43870.1 SusD/RagB family nutrient-binding outer membrane lipoprotein [Hwangdonia sp. SCSIO 19198]